MEDGRSPAITPERALLTARIIWGALLMGQLIFLVVVLSIGPRFPEPNANASRILFYVAAAMLVTLVPVAYVLRGVIYSRGRKDGVVAPQAYLTGNILFLALCEAVGMAGLAFGLLNRGSGPNMVIAVAAMAVQAINFPTGRAMRDDEAVRPMHRRPS